MKIKNIHPWNVTPKEAIRIQNELKGRVITKDRFKKVRTVAGCDIGFKGDTGQAAVVVMRYPGLEIIDYAAAREGLEMPYIPGLLSFREIPVLVSAFQKLNTEPDLVITDGQGIAHPRRMGIGAHLGLVLDKPTIGCAKSRLCGTFKEPPMAKGSYSKLYDNKDIIGAVLRTREKVSCVYVSPGHQVSLQSAITFILRSCTRYRLPEPVRMAHQVAGGLKPEIHQEGKEWKSL